MGLKKGRGEEWEREGQKGEIEDLILDQNVSVLKSSESTPFCEKGLKEYIGEYGEGEGVKEIL